MRAGVQSDGSMNEQITIEPGFSDDALLGDNAHGIHGIEGESVHRRYPELAEDLLVVKLQIGDHAFQQNLRKILYYGREDLESLEPSEIDTTLDAVSEWQITLAVAIAHLYHRLRGVDATIDEIRAEGVNKAEDRIIERRYAVLGRYTASVLQVSKDESWREFVDIDDPLYCEWMDKCGERSDLRKQIDIVESVADILKQRVTSLQGIARRSFYQHHGVSG